MANNKSQEEASLIRQLATVGITGTTHETRTGDFGPTVGSVSQFEKTNLYQANPSPRKK